MLTENKLDDYLKRLDGLTLLQLEELSEIIGNYVRIRTYEYKKSTKLTPDCKKSISFFKG